ncbi:MAG: IS110 family transposase [bacterium]
MKFEKLQMKRQFVSGKTIVGIDPSKRGHHATVLDSDGLQLGKSFSFQNSSTGFRETLWHKLKHRLEEVKPESVVFAVENSCNLWPQLTHYLHSCAYSVVLVSPVTTHRSRPFLNHDLSHTDPKDALLIASAARAGYFDFYRSYSEEMRTMQQLSLTYTKLLKSYQQHRTRLRSFVEQLFPEFVTILPLSTQSSRYVLKRYFLPEHFLTLDIAREARVLERISGKQHGEATLHKLREAAKSSIGIPKTGPEVSAARLTLESWLTLLEVLEQQLEQVMSELLSLVEETRYFEILTSLKGISSKLAALFIAETRELSSFAHYKQLEKYAGYNLRQLQSGEFVGRRHISRIGNRRLSWIIYKMTEETARYVPEVRIKYLRRQLQRRQYRNNLISCVPVLLKLIVRLVKENRLYQESEEKLAELSELEVRYEQATGNKSKRAVILKPAA